MRFESSPEGSDAEIKVSSEKSALGVARSGILPRPNTNKGERL